MEFHLAHEAIWFERFPFDDESIDFVKSNISQRVYVGDNIPEL